MSSVASFDGKYSVESVVSCNWCDGEIVAILDIVSLEEGRANYGPSVLRCEAVEYLVFAEEAVADRADLFFEEGHTKVFTGLEGFLQSTQSQLLKRLKEGKGFGEYVHHEAKHFIVRAPYNSFEFISFKKPSLAGHHVY